MIVLILQTLRTKYVQDLMPGVSKGDARSKRSCGSKLVAFWRSSQGKLYSIIWLSVKILWLQVTEIFLTKQRQKWWEGYLISHRVKEKAEQPSLKKDLKDGSSNVPKGKNLREIASGCQNDLIPTQLALWIHGLQIHRFNQLYVKNIKRNNIFKSSIKQSLNLPYVSKYLHIIYIVFTTIYIAFDSKEIQPVNPTGNQAWIFIGRTDAEAETPILWPPDAKSQLIGKDPDAGKDWGQKEKGVTEDETVGWHYQFSGHAFEQTLEDSEG